MAIIKGAFQMEGSISGVSFYSMAGSDKVIMRTKGGPTKRRMKEGKEFEMVRRHQTEWAACVLFSRGLKWAMGDTYRLADYNVSPVWNGIGKKLINLDEESTLGERHLRLSVYREAIAGFSLNKNYSFNAVMRAIPTFEVDKEKRSAIVRFPQINTGNDLLNVQKLPYFRLIVALGVVSDIHYRPENPRDKYEPALKDANGIRQSITTEWFSAHDIILEQTLEIMFNESMQKYRSDYDTLLLSVGIEFGTTAFGGKIEGVKRAGCARIMAAL
ncbi:hypothetical protein [Parabacteroides sp. FAFU027]|uniref:hypothetical protein n=1 Tax=Parabacteroides sp. FAFU027 TaxID=2922715 RepID=UPI001FB016DD|nr:hypothetical protein [Parabacteroides sp. FAFU027]